MSLYARSSIDEVLEKVTKGLRYIWPDPDHPVSRGNAFCYRRYQSGPRPLANLFHLVCRPMTSAATPGAFLFGLRLMAIDGTVEDVPDTPENVAAFGRHPGDRGDSAFPQVEAVYLAECGAHAIVDAGFWPCRTSERVGGFPMLRSVTADMLAIWDRGFHDFDMFQGVLRRGSHALGRLPAHVKPKHVRALPDGSHSDPNRLSFTHALQVIQEVISEFQMTAPELPAPALPTDATRHCRPTHTRTTPAHQPTRRQTQDVEVPSQTTGTPSLAPAHSLIPGGCGPYLKGIAPNP
jgi:hypothetical protein